MQAGAAELEDREAGLSFGDCRAGQEGDPESFDRELTREPSSSVSVVMRGVKPALRHALSSTMRRPLPRVRVIRDVASRIPAARLGGAIEVRPVGTYW